MAHNISTNENIIGVNSIFNGTIKLQGELRIDGTFFSKELHADHITVGKSGKIKANIVASSIVVEGTALGNITSSVRTMLLPTAKILGDILSPEVVIQQGVMWEGKSKITTNPNADISAIINKEFESK